MTVIPSGLGATWGCAQESTVGTPVTVTRWLPFLNEGLKGNKRVVESEALYGGLVQLASHRAIVGYEAKGPSSFELQDRQMGILFSNMLGATPTITGPVSTIYTQTYDLNNPVGMSMTVQIGRPTIAGVMEPFTYNGVKVVDWELSCSQGQIAKLALTFDAWGESTATDYAAPSSVSSNALNFSQGLFTLGGDEPVGVVKSVSIKGSWGVDVDRFQIGATEKDEQLVNNWLKLTTTAEIEFANLTDYYDAYAADTEQALVLSFTNPSTTTGVQLTLAANFLDTAVPEVKGPAVVTAATSSTALNPSSGYALEVVYTTLDAAA